MATMNDHIEFQWYWRSDDNSWPTEEKAQFIAYSPDINQIIELAYLNGNSEVVISKDQKIDFKNRLQIHLNGTHRGRLIVRQQLGLLSRMRTATINTERFKSSAESVRTCNLDTKSRGCDFILDWFKWITKGTLKIDKSKVVDLAINGILTEAQLYPDRNEAIEDANHFVKELREVQRAKELYIIQEVCIKLYTNDSFLYHIINQTLRDNNRSKFETLGPFCYLLYNYAGSPKNKHGKLPDKIVLYRGETLTPQVIEAYKLTVHTNTVWKWTQFVSTSKKRSVAESFGDGNSLYIIEMKKRAASDQGVYIASLSQFAVEDEVLLRPGIRFKMVEIEEQKGSIRQLFHIDVLPSYMSGLN